MENKNAYFPFETCERPSPDSLISQPYSTFVNVINTGIIFYFLTQTKHTYTFYFLLSVFLFELSHTLSHMYHIDGQIQRNVVHFFAYCINATLLYTLYCYSHILPSLFLLILIFLLVCFDIYSLLYLPSIFYIISQVAILFSIFYFYYSTLPSNVKTSILWLFLIGTLIIGLVYNEIRNCDEIAKLYPDAPFHILVEIPGVFFFFILSRAFYLL
jgi:hypothetical protein